MLGKSRLKYIQSLGQKKHRDEEGLFLAEGPKIVEELLQEHPDIVDEVFGLPSWIETRKDAPGLYPVTPVTPEELARISQLQTPNQVLAVLRQFPPKPVGQLTGSLTLALDAIRDPGNLGTIIRIADWFGIPRIVCSRDCADQYNPKVVQSSMGSIGRVQLHYLDLAGWLSMQAGVRIYGAALEGQDVSGMKRLTSGIIVIGNESKGISADVMEKVNVRITIVRKGKAESLNAAVATGIIAAHLAGN